MQLGVYLDDQLVGDLLTVRERVEFRLAAAYRGRYPRPVLGQVFEDDLDRVHTSQVVLPPFFANLLPEGDLRTLVARHLGIKAEREPHLLAHLGEDLPGAVRVRSLEPTDESDGAPFDAAPDEAADVLKFSLAGVQMKLSALHEGRGLTVPAHGRGGDWIVKLPDRRYPGVPENEWSMMTLARDAGLDVPQVALVPFSLIRGLPPDIVAEKGANVLAVKRFDRGPGGARIHIEDFAQVLDVRPTYRAKYGSANFETLARLVARIAPQSTEEFVRRLVFHVAIGNGDAHVKNWSLIYRDGVRPALSPAYDLVSTIQYIRDDDLGLKLARSRRFEDVTLASFARLRDKAELGLDARAVAEDMVARVREAWADARSSLPLYEDDKQRIEAHFASVPLMQGQ